MAFVALSGEKPAAAKTSTELVETVKGHAVYYNGPAYINTAAASTELMYSKSDIEKEKQKDRYFDPHERLSEPKQPVGTVKGHAVYYNGPAYINTAAASTELMSQSDIEVRD